MKRKLIFFFIFVVSVCAISNVSASDMADIASDACEDMENQVMSEIDSVDNYQQANAEYELQTVHKLDSNNNAFDDIQRTIDEAGEGDTIELNGTFSFNNVVNINKSIKIIGSGDGATISKGDAIKKFNYFNIAAIASNVVLSNLKFTSNHASAINWNGDNGVISNCIFENNNAQGEGLGGAINLHANNCNITDCSFKNNGAYNYGGAIYIEGENNSISYSKFEDNNVNSLETTVITSGGAIYSKGKGLTIDTCNFKGNSAINGNGGAVYVEGDGNIIFNSTFSDNFLSNTLNSTSLIGGGAIYSNSYALVINKSSFKQNKAEGLYGGAVSSNIVYQIENSLFDNNIALKGNDIHGISFSVVKNNHFILEFDENDDDAIYGINSIYFEENSFTFNKVASSVKFSAGMVFEYASSGSIYVTVNGGTISIENIKILNHSEAKITFSKNVLTVSNLAVGKYTLRVITTPDDRHNSVENDLSITVKKATAVIKASKVTVALKSGASWTIKIVDSKTGKPVGNMKLTLKVFTGKKCKTVHVTTNSKGEAAYKTKGLTKGTHKVIVSASHAGYNFNTLKSSITVVKPVPLKFKIQFKKDEDGGSIRSFLVLNKKTKKGINGVKVKVLIYTGKKYRSYTLKSSKKDNYKGAFGFATNDFSTGKHKVVLKPVSIKYMGSFKTSLTIKKKAAKGPKFFRVI